MDVEKWTALFGKSQDDAAVKKALAAAGVKQVPKLGANRTDVRVDLKGYGLSLTMTDEAFLKQLDDQDIGEGPLILTGISVYLDTSASNDVYQGKLPYGISPDATKADFRKTFGPPEKSNEQVRMDNWTRDGLKLVARYTKEWKVMVFGLRLPVPE